MLPNESENSSPAGLRVEYRPIEILIPFARNPRTHSDDQIGQIAASIREFGFTNPILLDGENSLIMVLGCAMVGTVEQPSVYDKRGILFL